MTAPTPAALAAAMEALDLIRDYFDQRADADAVGDPMRYQGNAEMHMLRHCDTILAALKEGEGWRACAEELAGALVERGEHHWSCNRADFRAGRPREGGGYEFNYGGTWYESRPVDRTPKCDCEMGAALTRFDAMNKGLS